MAGRKPKLTKEQVIEALKQSHGLKSGAAEILQVSYNTVDRYVAKHKQAQEIIDHWRIRRVDRAEYKLDEAIERAEPWAVALVLKGSKAGKDRGYGDRVDVTTDDKPVNEIVMNWTTNAGKSDGDTTPETDAGSTGEKTS